MTEKELINWAITVHAESAAALSRRYPSISETTISNWKKAGKFPAKSGWKLYFQAQFDKKGEK